MDNMSPIRNPNPNPNPNEQMLAFHFTGALARIRQNNPSHPPSHRGRRINRAAYASMALAAGHSRAWSQALLRRLGGSCAAHPKPRRVFIFRRRARLSRPRSHATREPISRVESLRRLIPGGHDIGLCRLLEETASYIQCLCIQVKLMQGIVNSSVSTREDDQEL